MRVQRLLGSRLQVGSIRRREVYNVLLRHEQVQRGADDVIARSRDRRRGRPVRQRDRCSPAVIATVNLCLTIIIIIIIITLCNIKKVQKSSWNEPYSSSSFTKQSCSKMALYR